jgi:hypothetical protein
LRTVAGCRQVSHDWELDQVGQTKVALDALA